VRPSSTGEVNKRGGFGGSCGVFFHLVAVADLVNLSRHRKHTLIFDVQNAAQLDRNIVSEADGIGEGAWTIPTRV